MTRLRHCWSPERPREAQTSPESLMYICTSVVFGVRSIICKKRGRVYVLCKGRWEIYVLTQHSLVLQSELGSALALKEAELLHLGFRALRRFTCTAGRASRLCNQSKGAPTAGILQPPPGIVQPPAGIVQAPPGVFQPPPGIIQLPPGIVQPPAGILQPPPGIFQPPPGIVQPRPVHMCVRKLGAART